jgi:hypothetical protein
VNCFLAILTGSVVFGVFSLVSLKSEAEALKAESDVKKSIPPTNSPQELTLVGFLRSEKTLPVSSAGSDYSYVIKSLAEDGAKIQTGNVVAVLEPKNQGKARREGADALLQLRLRASDQIEKLKVEIRELEEELSQTKRETEVLEIGNVEKSKSSEWLMSSREVLLEQLKLQSAQLKAQQTLEKRNRKKRLLEATSRSYAKQISLAELRLQEISGVSEKGTIRAKFPGVVVHQLNWKRERPQVGGETFLGESVAWVVDDTSLFVEAYVREEDSLFVRLDQEVRVRILGKREVDIAGKIMQISQVVLPLGDWERTLPKGHPLYKSPCFRLKVTLPLLPPEARPGGNVQVMLQRDRG